MIRADGIVTQLQEIVPGQQVQVQQQLFSRLIYFQAVGSHSRAAVIPRVLVTRFGALVIQPGPPDSGKGQVGLADPAANLLKQRLTTIVVAG